MINALRAWWIRSRLGKTGRTADLPHNKIYYESYGKGEPLMMFHGGMSSLRTFRYQIPLLSKYFRCILPEHSGNGHTADISQAFSYEQMADEMLQLMRTLGIKRAAMLGYSDGANLIFHLARKAPEVITKFICIGGNFHHAGSIESFKEEMRAMPDVSVGEGIDQYYARYSPNGAEHYAKVFHKTRTLWLTQPTLTETDVARITAPTLIISGDHDVISMEHTLKLYNALPQALLHVVAGTTHGVTKEKPDLVNPVILDFLCKPFPVFGEDVADVQK